MSTHEYAFDVKLAAVVRVTARSETDARRKLHGIDAVDLAATPADGLRITEASVDDCDPYLFEVDGRTRCRRRGWWTPRWVNLDEEPDQGPSTTDGPDTPAGSDV